MRKEDKHIKPEDWLETLNENDNEMIVCHEQAPDENNFYAGFPIHKEKPKREYIFVIAVVIGSCLLALIAVFYYFPVF